MTVVATGTRKSTEEDRQRIRELMGDEAIMIDEAMPVRCWMWCTATGGGHDDRRWTQYVHRLQSAVAVSGYQPGSASMPSPAIAASSR